VTTDYIDGMPVRSVGQLRDCPTLVLHSRRIRSQTHAIGPSLATLVEDSCRRARRAVRRWLWL